MKTLYLYISLLCATSAISQVNYMDYLQDKETTCSLVNAENVTNDFRLLDSLSKFEITEGEEFFLLDRAMNYYHKSILWQDEADQIKSINYSRLCWEKYANANALWNLAFNLIWSENYHEGIEYLDIFVTHKEAME